MATAYIALGSNLGERWEKLAAAVRRLRAEPGLRVVAVSRFYETAPVNCPPGSGDFLNAAVAIETDRTPEDLLQLLLRIERHFDRVRTEPNSPRTLDLDLLLYADRSIHSPDLVLPHPRLHERSFVLVPLAEIAPDAIHPTLGKQVQELSTALQDPNPPRALTSPEVGPVFELGGLRTLVTGSTSGIGAAIAAAFTGTARRSSLTAAGQPLGATSQPTSATSSKSIIWRITHGPLSADSTYLSATPERTHSPARQGEAHSMRSWICS